MCLVWLIFSVIFEYYISLALFAPFATTTTKDLADSLEFVCVLQPCERKRPSHWHVLVPTEVWSVSFLHVICFESQFCWFICLHFVLDEKVFGQKNFLTSHLFSFKLKVWKFPLKRLCKHLGTFFTK